MLHGKGVTWRVGVLVPQEAACSKQYTTGQDDQLLLDLLDFEDPRHISDPPQHSYWARNGCTAAHGRMVLAVGKLEG